MPPHAFLSLLLSRAGLPEEWNGSNLFEVSFRFTSFKTDIPLWALLCAIAMFALAVLTVHLLHYRFLFKSKTRPAWLFAVFLIMKYLLPWLVLKLTLVNGAGWHTLMPASIYMIYLVFSCAFLLDNVIYLFNRRAADEVLAGLSFSRAYKWVAVLLWGAIAWAIVHECADNG
ncbi:hypothetical protein DLD77_04425 [Chitinophaga alhagiae]|uniref:DUF5658 domain-containing protein n=2 Tax=Chitinophaga alhagiae TaxID=2203219 RepID=A0ABN5LNL4_9BACT|nr:hypothetical protein DLD77_04425 [Chitinophaga alhagiae]